jgi:hypothetical protein
MSASHPSDSEEIRQQERSREGHSIAAYKARTRNYRRQIRETQAVLQRTHTAWKNAWEENRRLRDEAGMHPWHAFENAEEHAAWRIERAKMARQAATREVVREIVHHCDRQHFSAAIVLACILFGGICTLAGYVIGRLHV